MDKLEQLLTSNFQLSSESISALLSLFKAEKLEKHEHFALFGEFSKKMAFIESGILRAYFSKSNGDEYNKTFFTKGKFVGAYSSLITGAQNQINIQCLTQCMFYTANYDSFTKLFDEYPEIERVARLIAENYFVEKERREIELVTLEAKERYKLFREEHPTLEREIPQYHIASYLGVSPTQLSRIRAQKK